MDGRTIEPRRVMWAVAEVSWAEAEGTAKRARATIEDMSLSGACIRVKSPIRIGARLTVRWHREQFSAVAKNCRKDGMEFLLGVQRSTERNANEIPDVVRRDVASNVSTNAIKLSPEPLPPLTFAANLTSAIPAGQPFAPEAKPLSLTTGFSPELKSSRAAPLQAEGSSARRERKVMPSKKLFPQFWRRQPEPDAPQTTPMEAPVNKTNDHAAETANDPRNQLLSYEDIYHAAGIMGPRSGYGIHKVVEMLNSERIRELSKDIKRASVLMALETAGASVDELLQDATRRQHALNSYEDGQRKQLEEFETRKAQENAKIQAEMERLAAHYAERIQQNRDQVAREKETLHNWQMAKQHESQRISEVLELCAKQPAVSSATGTMAAAAGQGSGTARDGALRPTLLSETHGRG